jgi:hypothetical protein
MVHHVTIAGNILLAALIAFVITVTENFITNAFVGALDGSDTSFATPRVGGEFVKPMELHPLYKSRT